MKKLFAVLLFISSFTQTKATTLIVDNNQNAPTPYSTISAAVNAAASGDTILVKASPTQYGNVTINNKEIHIVGEGYKPNYQTSFFTNLGVITFTTSGASLNASNSSVEGCKVNVTVTGASTNNINNITVKRCSISGGGINAYAGASFYNNIIYGGYSISYLSTEANFYNNIFRSYIYMNNAISTATFSVSPIFKNNIFINVGFGYAFYNYITNGMANASISDNIFYAASPYVDPGAFNYNTCSHNISFNSTNDNFNTTGTNNGGNNQVGVNPLFVSETNNTYNDTDDFHLQATSPGKNAGSDGTDVGIYGGLYPWPDGNESSGNGYMYSQEPQYPQVNQLILNNASVPQNGNINIQVRGIIND